MGTKVVKKDVTLGLISPKGRGQGLGSQEWQSPEPFTYPLEAGFPRKMAGRVLVKIVVNTWFGVSA